MLFCTQCGVKLKETDLFCFKCGAAVAQNSRETISEVEEAPARRQIQKKTSTNNKIVLSYKGVGIRLLAQIFDSIPMLIFYFIAGGIIASRVDGSTAEGFKLEGAPALALLLMSLIFSILYFTVFEAWWNGQSPGKKLLRIQVVNKDGSKINISTSFLRNALRLVDGFMGYLVGAILVWRSDTKQRLGDRLAGTVVIKKTAQPTRKKKKSKMVFGEKDVSMVDTFD